MEPLPPLTRPAESMTGLNQLQKSLILGAVMSSKVTWKQLSFLPSDIALAEFRKCWSWRFSSDISIVMASTLGDLFCNDGTGAVFWLNTGTAEFDKVADSRDEFIERLRNDVDVENWFMPHLIRDLMDAGKLLKEDYCYSYVIFPVFKEGKYELDNINPVPAREHFGVSGDLHRQIKDLPNGAHVEIAVTPEAQTPRPRRQ